MNLIGYLKRVFQGFIGTREHGQFQLENCAKKAKGEQSSKAGNKSGKTAETSEYPCTFWKGKENNDP